MLDCWPFPGKTNVAAAVLCVEVVSVAMANGQRLVEAYSEGTDSICDEFRDDE